MGFPICRKPRTISYLARTHGVTEEQFLKVVAARKKYRAARRDRARKVGAWGEQTYRSRRRADRLRAGEGEIHGWLRRLNMTGPEFCKLAGMAEATFNAWYGHCLWDWPVKLLALYAYARNMEKFLASKGYELEQFRDQPITEMFHQHYRIQKPSNLILDGITPEERARMKSESAKKAAEVRWKGAKDPDYTPWKL